MAEGRGKKTKKPRWQLVLGLKQVICGALGLTWVMVIIFILGVLAGRGDIYRWLSGWGLITPVSPQVAQWLPPPAATTAPGPAKSQPPGPSAAAPQTATSAATPSPVTGSIAPTTSPAPSSKASRGKKVKKRDSRRDHKARKEELRRLRQELAAKLKFQNSFDSKPQRAARTAQKNKDKAAADKKPQSRQVRVGQFRNLKTAKARMAELQKRGEKVTLKTGKDQKGAYYEIYREAPAKPSRGDVGLAKKSKKSGGNESKKPAEKRN